MSPELENILQNTLMLKQTLSKVLPPVVVTYIMELITKDLVHRKFLKLTKED